MARRLSKAASPLNEKQRDLAARASELQNKMKELERVIAEAPRVKEEETRRNREVIHLRAGAERNRLDVSMAIPDKRFADDFRDRRPRGALRKQQREGRLVFIVLVIALFVIVVWLATHLHF